MRWQLRVFAGTMALLVGCAGSPLPKPSTPAEWAARATTKTDHLDATIQVRSGGPISVATDARPKFVNGLTRQLTASVDKTTGEYRVGVFIAVDHWNQGWAHVRRATYIGTNNKVRVASEVHRVDSRPDCNPSYCSYFESAVFFLMREELQILVEAHKAKMIEFSRWPVRFEGSGRSFDVEFEWAEIEGFLQAAEAARSSVRRPPKS